MSRSKNPGRKITESMAVQFCSKVFKQKIFLSRSPDLGNSYLLFGSLPPMKMYRPPTSTVKRWLDYWFNIW